MFTKTAKVEIKKNGRTIKKVTFEYEEATSITDAKKLAKTHYNSTLPQVFNRFHRMRQMDHIRRVELMKLGDPLKDMREKVKEALRGIENEKEMKEILDLIQAAK